MISYAGIIYEYFDPSNSKEFTELISLDEESQDRVLVSLATKLYDHIVNEITDIDFGGIPGSKGDITKIPNYLDLIDSINIIREICIRFKESTQSTDILFKAIDNLKDTKAIWQKSFNTGVGLGINTYNSLALSIVCGTSLLISTSIEYIKYPDTDEFDFVLNKVEHSKSLNSVLFNSLKEFNKGCETGEFMKAIIIANNSKRNIAEAELMSFDENAIFSALVDASKIAIADHFPGVVKSGGAARTLINGSKGAAIVISSISALLLLTAIVIPTIRNAVSWFYNSKQKLSDYFAIQATLIEMNANNLRYNESRSEEERNKISDKQIKIANKFKSLSNTLSTKMKKAEKLSKDTLEKESNEKLTTKDVEDVGKVSNLF